MQLTSTRFGDSDEIEQDLLALHHDLVQTEPDMNDSGKQITVIAEDTVVDFISAVLEKYDLTTKEVQS